MPEDRASLISAFEAALAGEGPLCHSFRFLTLRGTALWTDLSGVCDASRAWLLLCDARPRKAEEARLTRFLSSISCLLREPASAVLLSAGWLAEHDCVAHSPDALFLVSAIRAACRFLLGCLANVLSVEEVGDHSTNTLTTRIFSPTTLLKDLIKVVSIGGSVPGGVTWPSEDRAAMPPQVEADEQRIAQVLQNLVSNALKFSSSRVVVNTSVAPLAGEMVTITFVVSDDGRGMSKSELATCFQVFKHSTCERGGGFGLGLYIAQEFARLLQGTLEAVSRPGEGATFTFTVPVRVVPLGEALPPSKRTSCDLEREAPMLPELALPPARRCRCLIVDDHGLNRKLLARLFTVHGFDVVTAADGVEGLEALQRDADLDIVLMDMQMPRKSGCECVSEFREWEARSGRPTRLHITALTANALGTHEEECRVAGMDGFLTKPLSADTVKWLHKLAVDVGAQRLGLASMQTE